MSAIKATMANMLDINANQLIQLGEKVYFIWQCGFVTKMNISFLF